MAGPQDRPAGLKTEDGGLETELQLARVIGTVVATQKHQAFTGAKLLLVQPVGLDDTPRGTALLAVDSVLRTGDGTGHHQGPLAREIDRVLSGAHEFTELRLLSALRSGSVTLPNRDADDGERLLGDAGASPAARLGLAPETPSNEVADAAYAALERWRRHTVNPPMICCSRRSGTVRRER